MPLLEEVKELLLQFIGGLEGRKILTLLGILKNWLRNECIIERDVLEL
jgi:hypothetical protein